MVQWYSPMEILKDLEVYKILLAVPSLLYLLTKSSWILTMAVTSILIWTERKVSCSALAMTNEAVSFLVSFASAGLLACRAYAVYDTRRLRSIAGGILVLFGLAVTGVWIAGMGSIKLMWVNGAEDRWKEGQCVLTQTEKKLYWRTITVAEVSGTTRSSAVRFELSNGFKRSHSQSGPLKPLSLKDQGSSALGPRVPVDNFGHSSLPCHEEESHERAAAHFGVDKVEGPEAPQRPNASAF
ncbi:hypothetical protein V8E36_006034 [Tilletia maclaganii]